MCSNILVMYAVLCDVELVYKKYVYYATVEKNNSESIWSFEFIQWDPTLEDDLE